jgi:hypothetical protein
MQNESSKAAKARYQLEMYVIYENPKDFPNKWILQRCVVICGIPVSDTIPVAIEDSLESVRRAVPPGLVRMDRFPNDDPVIREVWI